MTFPDCELLRQFATADSLSRRKCSALRISSSRPRVPEASATFSYRGTSAKIRVASQINFLASKCSYFYFPHPRSRFIVNVSLAIQIGNRRGNMWSRPLAKSIVVVSVVITKVIKKGIWNANFRKFRINELIFIRGQNRSLLGSQVAVAAIRCLPVKVIPVTPQSFRSANRHVLL